MLNSNAIRRTLTWKYYQTFERSNINTAPRSIIVRFLKLTTKKNTAGKKFVTFEGKQVSK